MSTSIHVTGEHPSTITVGHGLGFEPIRDALDEAATRVLIIHARPLAQRAQSLAEYLREQGIEASTADHPDAEAGKTIDVVASLWDECGRLQLGRKDAIVAMGGGATTDMAGFVAATWLRGITLINVPTTLLAMVDAAVGGKTGINTSVGKNLVGSFYPAAFVIADMDLLDSLPAMIWPPEPQKSSSAVSSRTRRFSVPSRQRIRRNSCAPIAPSSRTSRLARSP